ncbi:hypothetical protein FGG08_007120 [Glutinoglossum americanum]|uniref:Uncharacterized protein n=1 Tax=Glutinoglossum americanum TaxID=1670608 RepID=A0A9P8KUA4_9PEZI|nr:hypothetical protein FGG08_007120 [Glutinoglossum americanum]
MLVDSVLYDNVQAAFYDSMTDTCLRPPKKLTRPYDISYGSQLSATVLHVLLRSVDPESLPLALVNLLELITRSREALDGGSGARAEQRTEVEEGGKGKSQSGVAHPPERDGLRASWPQFSALLLPTFDPAVFISSLSASTLQLSTVFVMDVPYMATILLLNLPPGALCGMDLLSFTTSPRFRGIRLLPKGIHFIYTGATTFLSVRHGVWIDPETSGTGPGETIIKIWDIGKEELVSEEDQAEQLRWKASIGGSWREHLTPYRQSIGGVDTSGSAAAGEEGKIWGPLVDCITPSLLSRITGGQRNDWTLSTSSAMKQDMEDIPGLGEHSTIRQEKELNFLPINLRQTWREGAIGRERTEAAKDRSWALGEIVAKHCSGDEKEVVGEMEFCFLMVLTLNNFSCLEQWKRLLNLVFTCQRAVKDREDLYMRILRVLRLQLQRCNDVEGGLFDLTDEGGAMLIQLLKGFRRGLEDVYENEGSGVRDEFGILEAYAQREFGWELNDSFVRKGVLELEDGEQVEMELNELEGEDERGEYAPVIVYPDGNGNDYDTY